MSTRNKHSISPLLVKNNSAWIENKPLQNESLAKLRIYASRFVIESEAINTSHQTQGFIKDFHINTTQRVKSFMRQLCFDDVILYGAKNSPEELAKLLIRENLADDEFIHAEIGFVYFSFSGLAPVVKQISLLREFGSSATRKSGAAKQNKSEFFRLDAFFRHLRNAIAHGQYKRVERQSSEVFWAFQDSNTKGKVTSRMLIPESLLDTWVHLFCMRDKRYRKNQ